MFAPVVPLQPARWGSMQLPPVRAASTPPLQGGKVFRSNLSFDNSRKRQPSVENLRVLTDA